MYVYVPTSTEAWIAAIPKTEVEEQLLQSSRIAIVPLSRD